jgi:hypothetical protein
MKHKINWGIYKMTLQEIKRMQAARRQAIKTPRDALRKMHNTHDPHDMHTWENNKPMWLLPLQVLGVIAMSIGLFILMDYALWSIRVVLSL